MARRGGLRRRAVPLLPLQLLLLLLVAGRSAADSCYSRSVTTGGVFGCNECCRQSDGSDGCRAVRPVGAGLCPEPTPQIADAKQPCTTSKGADGICVRCCDTGMESNSCDEVDCDAAAEANLPRAVPPAVAVEGARAGAVRGQEQSPPPEVMAAAAADAAAYKAAEAAAMQAGEAAETATAGDANLGCCFSFQVANGGACCLQLARHVSSAACPLLAAGWGGSPGWSAGRGCPANAQQALVWASKPTPAPPPTPAHDNPCGLLAGIVACEGQARCMWAPCGCALEGDWECAGDQGAGVQPVDGDENGGVLPAPEAAPAVPGRGSSAASGAGGRGSGGGRSGGSTAQRWQQRRGGRRQRMHALGQGQQQQQQQQQQQGGGASDQGGGSGGTMLLVLLVGGGIAAAAHQRTSAPSLPDYESVSQRFESL